MCRPQQLGCGPQPPGRHAIGRGVRARDAVPPAGSPGSVTRKAGPEGLGRRPGHLIPPAGSPGRVTPFRRPGHRAGSLRSAGRVTPFRRPGHSVPPAGSPGYSDVGRGTRSKPGGGPARTVRNFRPSAAARAQARLGNPRLRWESRLGLNIANRRFRLAFSLGINNANRQLRTGIRISRAGRTAASGRLVGLSDGFGPVG